MNDSKIQLLGSDVILLVPVYVKENFDYIKYNGTNNDYFNVRNQNFIELLKDEFENDFIKDIYRYFIAETQIIIKNDSGEALKDKCIFELAVHNRTKFGVFEVYINTNTVGGNKILINYSSDNIEFEFENRNYKLADLLNILYLSQYGRKRSIVFTNNDVNDYELINCLANEEYPMANIKGFLKNEIENDDIASYDSASVYVSDATMVEKCKTFESIYENRIGYEIIETFFVEMILLADSINDRISKELQAAQDKQFEDIYCDSSNLINRITFEMSWALRFSDFNAFKYPTVRHSARVIAKKFGIDYIYEKYQMNKDVLNQMVAINERIVATEESKITTVFLQIITLIELFKTVYELILNVVNNENSLIIYLQVLFIIFLGSILYVLLKKEVKKKIIHKFKGWKI